MARNVFYTDEEKRILANLIEDMAELSNMDLARIAHRYGLFPNRTEKGLSLQIGKMKMTPQSADDESNSEDEQLDIEKEILRAENARLKEQYEGLLNAVVGQADIYTNLNAPSLKLNLAAIRKWVYGNVPERVNARIEELMAE